MRKIISDEEYLSYSKKIPVDHSQRVPKKTKLLKANTLSPTLQTN